MGFFTQKVTQKETQKMTQKVTQKVAQKVTQKLIQKVTKKENPVLTNEMIPIETIVRVIEDVKSICL